MDSITQVVLGAACGEMVGGKKIGNRAMIWGGIGGTIPDLDVLSNVWMNPLEAMTFHRGPMHSLLFAIVVPFILGPLVKKLYDGDWHTRNHWKWIGFGLGLLLFLLASTAIYILSSLMAGHFPWVVLLALLSIGVFFFRKRFLQLSSDHERKPNLTVKLWIQLFFWAIFTHPLLDSLTTYGTQLFWPFSDLRVSLSTVSIVDPLYTIPFALTLLFAAILNREDKLRAHVARAGLLLSSLFLLFTVWNKNKVNTIFENTLKLHHVEVTDYMTVPTIFNNALWYGIGKTDTGFVCSYYSIFDEAKTFESLQFLSSHHQLMKPYENQEICHKLSWFSDGYYQIQSNNDSIFHHYDLRFGSTNGDLTRPEGIIFKMKMVDRGGKLCLLDEDRPDNKREDIEWFKKRIFGESIR